ncbi:MAG: cell division protein FtsQ [Lachnospiraceae bacterium]|nr:cell division protein FtsQ [Agathobacter sp.]MDD6291392.1 cell division protein FtsQ [Lachnospiraceae bacterium]
MIREKRKKARRRKNILSVLLAVMIVLAAAALIILKVFCVKKIVVEGNELYDSKVIENAVLNDEYSWNSLYVFIKYKFVDTKEIPFIDTMEISLEDPQTLHIKVYEKGMMGYLYIPSINENAYFDKDGLVVETSSEVIGGTPQIIGIDCDKVVLYEKLPIDGARLREILTLTQALKRNSLIPDSITYGVANEPELSYGNVKVKMGSLELLTQKVERLAKIKPKLKGLNGTLHLENWTEETTNIVFDKTEDKKKDKKK